MTLLTGFFRNKLPRWVAPTFLAVCAFLAFLETLPATISFEDSAEFVTASASLGIAHPSGYPLYVLLGKAFSLLPFGTIPWRLALFSAVCASAALAVLFVVARALVEAAGERVDVMTELLMVAVLGALAFSPTWWSQAVYAKVYALHVLLLGAVALFLLRWSSRKKTGDLFLTSLFFGLACANHLFLTLAIGPWLLAALAIGQRQALRWRHALIAAFGGALGLLPYLYILLRMPSAPYATVTFNHASQLRKFVMRSNYADVGVGGSDKFGLVASFGQSAYADVGLVILLLAIVGAVVLIRRKSAASPLIAGVVTAPLLVIGLRSFGFSEVVSYIYRVYGLPSEAFAAMLAAVGVSVAWNAAVVRRAGVFRYVLAALIIALPACVAVNAAPVVRVTTDPFIDIWLRGTLASLPPNAALIVAEDGLVSDTELFGLAYLQVVEGARRDVTVVTDTGVRPFYRPKLPAGEPQFPLTMRRRMLLEAAMKDVVLKGRPLFTSFAPETVSKRTISRATGYAFALDRNAPLPSAPQFHLPADAIASYAVSAIAAHLSYLQASRISEISGAKAALPTLLEAMRLDPVPESGDYLGFVHHRSATAKVER